MTQDTRKDRRVKIVSLNVRYKSATVDEFIENHAHDVSRGGIYIKTGSPFPPGTLLKFEIRLVSDQALIMGVGRVVWKRDTSQGTGDRPAGMGVKFIKIDEPSKSVIDRLMNTRADAGRAYESEAEVTVSPSEAAPSQVRAPAGRVGKSTMLGVGSLPQPGAGSAPSTRPLVAPSSPPRPAATIAMFPKATPEAAAAEPKQEQTVMKQAAELLEEALREAGGSMEDVGTNPLFASAVQAGRASAGDQTSETSKAHLSDGSGVSPSSAPEATKARAMVAGMSPAPPSARWRRIHRARRASLPSPEGVAPEQGETVVGAAIGSSEPIERHVEATAEEGKRRHALAPRCRHGGGGRGGDLPRQAPWRRCARGARGDRVRRPGRAPVGHRVRDRLGRAGRPEHGPRGERGARRLRERGPRRVGQRRRPIGDGRRGGIAEDSHPRPAARLHRAARHRPFDSRPAADGSDDGIEAARAPVGVGRSGRADFPCDFGDPHGPDHGPHPPAPVVKPKPAAKPADDNPY